MSIRRGLKKKIVDLISNEEENAKQRLFEISNFDDGTQEDHSEILVSDRRDRTQPTFRQKESPTMMKKEREKKKSRSLALQNQQTLLPDYQEDIKSVRESKRVRLATLQDNNNIVNAIQSNKVFVGNKNCPGYSARTYQSENKTRVGESKRIETMPAIKQKSHFHLQKIQQSSLNKLQVKLENPNPSSQRCRFAGFQSNKIIDRESYFRLKLKLRRDLFIGLQQKLSKKYEFFL